MNTDVKGFRNFILRGNVVDLAVAFVIGIAFKGVIDALVAGIIDPLITAIIGKPSFGSLHFTVHHSLFNYGLVIAQIIDFLAVAAVIYFLVVKPVGALFDRFNPPVPDEPDPTKDCPECRSVIPAAATRCAFCTVEQ